MAVETQIVAYWHADDQHEVDELINALLDAYGHVHPDGSYDEAQVQAVVAAVEWALFLILSGLRTEPGDMVEITRGYWYPAQLPEPGACSRQAGTWVPAPRGPDVHLWTCTQMQWIWRGSWRCVCHGG